MYEFAPPGRGYAYGETIPIFIFSKQLGSAALLRRLATGSRLPDSLVASESLLVHSFLLVLAAPSAGHCASGALDRVADHRPPLLLGCAVEVLAERPAAARRSGLVVLERRSALP